MIVCNVCISEINFLIHVIRHFTHLASTINSSSLESFFYIYINDYELWKIMELWNYGKSRYTFALLLLARLIQVAAGGDKRSI